MRQMLEQFILRPPVTSPAYLRLLKFLSGERRRFNIFESLFALKRLGLCICIRAIILSFLEKLIVLCRHEGLRPTHKVPFEVIYGILLSILTLLAKLNGHSSGFLRRHIISFDLL